MTPEDASTENPALESSSVAPSRTSLKIRSSCSRTARLRKGYRHVARTTRRKGSDEKQERPAPWWGFALAIVLCVSIGGCTPSSPSFHRSREAPPDRETPALPLRPLETDPDIEALAALGYVSGYNKPTGSSGVLSWAPDRIAPGLNLVVSGHRPEAILLSMSGEVLHRWAHDPPASYQIPKERRFWRRVRLLEDGSLLALFDPYGLIKLDRQSNLIWATAEPDAHHHDLDVAADGRIYTLGKRTRVVPEIHESVRVIEDMVVVLSKDGQVLERVSILEAFLETHWSADVLGFLHPIAEATFENGQTAIEDFHTNTLEILDHETLPPALGLEHGQLMLASPHHNSVYFLDLDRGIIVWNWRGPWSRVHEPQLDAFGRLLIFHNNGYKEPERRSEVLLYDLATLNEVGSWSGPPDRPFFSGTSSTVAPLENGNTMVVATESGSAFELSPEWDIVWEYHSPFRTGDDDQLVAALFQLDRIPPSQFGWLQK